MIPLREILVRLTLAALLGAIIGVERDLRRRPAGVRTSLFVCLATALFTILSGEIARVFGDTGSTRIASNIVQGVGFLGAGAILRGAGSVIGMTTAAVIFVEAAIGMAAGGGLYAVAIYSTALVLFGLICMAWIANRLNLKFREMIFRITSSHADSVATEVQRLMASLNVPMRHFRVSMAGETSIVEFESEVTHGQQEAIVTQLNRQGVTTEVMPYESGYE
ncbi:MAG TPA: MgtC/SapB family protein [Candidatus Acidoferrum sp.]|nr:MgtC/SapB family protein [Candidatus Acidoferrum sp.]